MSNINLVKLRNLDPEVLAYIRGHMPSGNDPMPYLKQSDLAPYFNKNTDLVDELLVTDNLKDHIVNLAVSRIAASKVYRRNADAIYYNDLDSELKKKIDKIEALSNYGIPQDLLDNIEAIKLSYNQTTAAISAIDNKIEVLKNSDELIKNSIETVNTGLLAKINANKAEIDALKANPVLSLTQEQINSVVNITGSINDLNDVVNKINSVQANIETVKITVNESKAISEQAKTTAEEAKNAASGLSAKIDEAKTIGERALSDIENVKNGIVQIDGKIEDTKKEIQKIQPAIDKVQNNVDKVQNTVNENKATAEQIKMDVQKNTSDINQLKTDISNASGIGHGVLTEIKNIKTNADQLQNQIKENRNNILDAKMEINSMQTNFRQIRSNFDGINQTGKPGASIYLDGSYSLKARNNLAFWKIVHTEEDKNNLMTEKKEDLFYCMLDGCLYVLEETAPNVKEYRSDEPPFDATYYGIFVYDDKSSTLYYSGETGLFAVGSGKEKTLSKRAEILANNELTIMIPSAFDSEIFILILDEDPASRTNGQYINSEGYITVAYEENQIILYNDAEKNANIRVAYRINATKKARADIEIESGENHSLPAYDPYSPNIRVLVLDERSGSKTYGKYINADQVAGLARTNTDIIIYNDTTEKIKVRVIY